MIKYIIPFLLLPFLSYSEEWLTDSQKNEITDLINQNEQLTEEQKQSAINTLNNPPPELESAIQSALDAAQNGNSNINPDNIINSLTPEQQQQLEEMTDGVSSEPNDEDNWACTVILCLANPNGPMAVSECVAPIKKFFEWQLTHSGLPSCPGTDASISSERVYGCSGDYPKIVYKKVYSEYASEHAQLPTITTFYVPPAIPAKHISIGGKPYTIGGSDGMACTTSSTLETVQYKSKTFPFRTYDITAYVNGQQADVVPMIIKSISIKQNDGSDYTTNYGVLILNNSTNSD